jgi:hypothetical protein
MTETADDQGFDVHLRRSGRTLTVLPGETILDILLDNASTSPSPARMAFAAPAKQK